MKIHNVKKDRMRNIITIVILITISVVVAAVWYLPNDDGIDTPPDPTDENTEVSNIDYSAPTKQEIADGQTAKKNALPHSADRSSTKKSSVEVGISYADINGDDKLEIRAFTNGAIDGHGVCTAKLTKGSAVVTKKSSAFIDASSSICQPILMSASSLSSGIWKLSVNFDSDTHAGSSEVREVSIP